MKKYVLRNLTACLTAAVLCITALACNEPSVTPTESESQAQSTEILNTEEESKMAEYDSTGKILTGKAVEVKTEMIPATKEECLKAMFASMWAFYDKNPLMQYDETYMTVEGYRFSYRNTAFESPEFATRDEYHFNVCNTFVQGVYNDAFGMTDYHDSEGLIYVTKSYRNFTGPHVVYSVSDPSEADLKNVVVPQVKKLLQPGDFICSYGDSGHVMLFLGDIYGDGKNYLVHSWGRNCDAEGMERYEEEGSVTIQTEDELLYNAGARWELASMKHSSSHVVIVRLFDADFFPNAYTSVAESRMKYPHMTIEKYLSVPAYHTVTKGEKLTLNVEVTNKSDEDYQGLRIAENLPEGVKLCAGTQEVTVDVKAGETYTFSLEVEVDAVAGQTIVFPKGAVAEIPTKEITVRVGASHVGTETMQKIKETALDNMKKGAKDGSLAFVNQVYLDATGVDLGLPKTVKDYVDLMLKVKNSRNVTAQMFVWKDQTEENEALFRMQAPKMFGGRYYEANRDISNRILCLREKDLEPGDIIIRMTGNSQTSVLDRSECPVYLYFGDNVVMEITTTAHQNYLSQSVDYLLQSNFFTVLRPARIYDFSK